MRLSVFGTFLLLLCFAFDAFAYKHKGMSRKPRFEDFMKKYSLGHKYKRVLRRALNKKPTNFAINIMNSIDPIEDLLKFDIDMLPSPWMSSRRQNLKPGHNLLKMGNHKDVWLNRGRLYELMKQTLYVARDKLLIVNALREKYVNNSLFKMGYLFSKTDDQAKLFSQLAFKGYIVCKACRERINDTTSRTSMTDLQEIIERLLSHWFETDLLAEVINVNVYAARHALSNWRYLPNLKSWFIDEFFSFYEIEEKLKAASRQWKQDDLKKKQDAHKRREEDRKKQEEQWNVEVDKWKEKKERKKGK